MDTALKAILEGTSFDSLDEGSRRNAIRAVLKEDAPTCQVAALLTLLAREGESAETVKLFSEELLQKAVPVSVEGAADIVGTGGDGKNTLNVSTPASLIAAAMGVPVAKHGNRSASAHSGSADVAEYLGGCLTLTPDQAVETLKACSFCFIFAPNFHPALKPLGPIRKQLGFKTVFNLLGPLLNPCKPTHMVVGVGKREKVDVIVGALEKNSNLKCLVVHSEDGLDKISSRVATHTWLVQSGTKTKYEKLTPTTLGLTPTIYDSESYFEGGGGPIENAATIIRVLEGRGRSAQDFVCVQAAALAVVTGKAASYAEGLSQARSVIENGSARALLDEYVRKSTLAGKAGSTDILSRIMKRRTVDLMLAKEAVPYATLEERVEARKASEGEGGPVPLLSLFSAEGFGFCAELKRASPSEGDISSGRDVVELARVYAGAGVQVISVLTEPVWFKGSLEDLAAVRTAV